MSRDVPPATKEKSVISLPIFQKNFDTRSHGLARESVILQGLYEAGGSPILFDPKWTRQYMPEAVLLHENVHQELQQQTFHGVLTLILTAYADVANASASLDACRQEQWVVQELGATYAELAFVQRFVPQDFSAIVNALPSAAKGGDPYREVFDFANWLLPLDDADQRERFDPRTTVIGALCICSMGTACLRELASSDFDDTRFASWIRSNSPRARLEQIAQATGPALFLEMIKTVTERFQNGKPTDRVVLQLFEELSAVMLSKISALTAEPLDDLKVQAQAAVDRLRATCPIFDFDVESSLQPRGPLFTDPLEKREFIEEKFSRFNNEPQEIDGWLQACQRAGGLHMISGVPDQGKVLPITFVCIPTFPGNPAPDDLRVRISLEQFFECIKRFPGFPKVMSMIADGWWYWDSFLEELPENDWARERVGAAIHITVLRSLSYELLDWLLMHDNLYDGARSILLALENGGGVALFDNPKVKAVYAIQKITSELALKELRIFLKQNSVEEIKDPFSIIDFELLWWIVQREFTLPFTLPQ